MPAALRPTRALVAALAASLILGGCYTLQAVRGQLQVLAARRPLEQVRSDPATDARTAALLAVAAEARDLTLRELGLRSGSYRTFVRLPREWPVWSVVVAPELDVEPRRQCFLVVGCLDYRGFFADADARAWAERARSRGDDAHVAPVPAYSTLGWFDDPLLWSALRWDEATLAEFVAHELAHEALYTGDDTSFDEAFAEVVARALVERMFATPERSAMLSRWRAEAALGRARQELLLAARGDLAALYASEASVEAKRAGKAARLARLDAELAAIDPSRPAGAWDNARLALVATYAELVPGFEALLAAEAGDLARFRARAAELAKRSAAERRAALTAARGTGQRSSRARAP